MPKAYTRLSLEERGRDMYFACVRSQGDLFGGGMGMTAPLEVREAQAGFDAAYLWQVRRGFCELPGCAAMPPVLATRLYDGYNPRDGIQRSLEGRARADLPGPLLGVAERRHARCGPL